MMNDVTTEFILSSFELLQNKTQGLRYYHELTCLDNSPTVVHRNTNQLTYVVSGEGVALINGTVLPISQGTKLFIPAGATHSFTTKDKMILFHIHIPDSGRDTDRIIVEGDDYNRYTP